MLISKLESVQAEDTEETHLPLRTILLWGVTLGLLMNWMTTYLKISMGFVSVGVGPMVVLLVARSAFKKKGIATRKNLTAVLITYGATQAAEASIGLLFLLWLFSNQSFFNMSFHPPWWLLPSPTVLESRNIFSSEWLVPLAVHYFLMIVPGILGIAFGWILKDSFISDDSKYPFPGVISRNTQVEVLTDGSQEKGPLFWKFARYGFFMALFTTVIPNLMIIDLSNLTNGSVFGIMFGPVGFALLAAGIIIGNRKLTIGSATTSIVVYSFLGIFLVDSFEGDFMGLFNLLLKDYYFSPALGIMLGGLLIGPILWSIIRSKKNNETQESDETNKDNEEIDKSTQEKLEIDNVNIPSKITIIKSVLKSHWKAILLFTLAYFLMVIYVQSLHILPNLPLWGVAFLVFWITIVGGMVNGYIITVGTAKANTAIAPPFIFDSGAIFLAGGSGYVPYLATPMAETDGSAGIIAAQKLAKLNDISSRYVLITYISGYIATTITTPLFALLMWKSFGIGTAQFPAPAFAVQGAIVSAFAGRNISGFLNIQLFILFMIISMIFAFLGSNLMMGITIGLLFPPHMAIMLAIGGIIRVFLDRKLGKEKSKDKSAIIGPGIAVGASFVLPIMIILSMI